VAVNEKSTFVRVANEYRTRYVEKRQKARSQVETWRPFRRLFIPAWGARHVGSITRRDIKEVLNRLVDDGAGVEANRAKTKLSGFFNWALDEGYVETSPVAKMRNLVAEAARDRVLADWELRLVWTAAGKMAFPYRDVVRLLALCAQRRDEVSRLARSELRDIETPTKARWELPAERTKAGRIQVVPLSKQALAIITAAPAPVNVTPKGDFVFSTTNGVVPIGSYSKLKNPRWSRRRRPRGAECGARGRRPRAAQGGALDPARPEALSSVRNAAPRHRRRGAQGGLEPLA
jgi:integrase